MLPQMLDDVLKPCLTGSEMGHVMNNLRNVSAALAATLAVLRSTSSIGPLRRNKTASDILSEVVLFMLKI
jgi:hypothetical protein